MDNCISVNLRKNKIVIKIAENAEQRKILSALTKKLPELKKLYRDEKTPIIIVGKVLKNKEIAEMQEVIKDYINVDVE